MHQRYSQNSEAFDSISQQSDESTVASDFVAQQIKLYNESLPNDSVTRQVANADNVQVVKIHVDAVNIYGESEGIDLIKFYSMTNSTS